MSKQDRKAEELARAALNAEAAGKYKSGQGCYGIRTARRGYKMTFRRKLLVIIKI